MIHRLRELPRAFRRRPKLAALTLVLFALAASGAYAGGRHLWCRSNLRAARQALERRDTAEARARLARCLWAAPDDPEVHLLAARAAWRDGAHDEADQHLTRCKQLGGEDDAVTRERALLLASRGELKMAEGYLLGLLKKEPPDAAVLREALVQGYLKTLRLVEALGVLDAWLKEWPDDALALVWRGQVLERQHDSDGALASYAKAVAAAPDDEPARRHLAMALVRSDRAEEAAEHLEWLRARSSDADVLLGLARCRRVQGRADEAAARLDELLAAAPDHPAALAERGKLALQAGDAGGAEQWLRRSLERAPHERETHYTLYLCLLRQGRKDEAGRVLETVERIRADFQRVADLTRRLSSSPADAALRCEVGRILLRNGQAREGVRWLTSALQIDPNHREARQALAEHARPK